MQHHPASAIFPLLAEAELKVLAVDIGAHGLRVPILLHEGKILDGRNRFAACKLAGVSPTFETFVGGSLVAAVVSLNLHRRHLEKGQLACCAVAAIPLLEAEAKERQRKHAGTAPGKGKSLEEKMPQVSGRADQARDKAGETFGVSGRYVSDAIAVGNADPKLFERVKSGELRLPDANRELKRREHAAKVESAAMAPKTDPEGPFDLILADPPWQYDFSETGAREIENQYLTSTVDEICSHAPRSAKDCLLLLWATAPKLREALAVMEAWGFEYKSNAVWDKEKIGMGYWFRGQHELLLVGTKGKFSPPIDSQRVPSVFREKRTGHSRKPLCVYKWIESAFPGTKKLEMYCRLARKGWSSWGNEV